MDIKGVPNASELASYRKLVTAAERASRTKGQIPRDNPLADLQVLEHMMARQLSMNQPKINAEDFKITTTPVPPPYPPSIRSIKSLTHLPIAKMKLEEHHRGAQVLVRTMTPPDRMNAFLTIVEDQEGTAVLLELYNQPEESLVKADDILPEGSVCIVKGTFLKATTNGGYSLRVDHVDDIVVLQSDDVGAFPIYLRNSSWREESSSHVSCCVVRRWPTRRLHSRIQDQAFWDTF